MPRQISPDTLNYLVTRTGLEPVNIISIQWVAGGGYHNYSDRIIPGIVEGKLIEVADLEAVLDIEKAGSSTSVKVVLDDTDGTIKNIFNNHDINGRRAVIYQWFTDMPIGERFPIFEGAIASPIVWNEGDRTFTFDIITKIEDVEVGFVVEDGNYSNVPSIILNKAWPLVFGTVLDMPTLRMDDIPVGVTKIPIGIPDATMGDQVGYMNNKINEQAGRNSCLSLRAAELIQMGVTNGDQSMIKRGKALEQQAFGSMQTNNTFNIPHTKRLGSIHTDMQKYDVAIIPIINGHRFKQGTPFEIKINEASYYGTFQGDNFQVISRLSPNEDLHRAPGGGTASSPGQYSSPVEGTQNEADRQTLARTSWKVEFPPDNEEAAYWACQPPFFMTFSTNREPNTVGEKNRQKFFFAQAGAHVSVGSGYTIRYIITIVPGVQVLWLSAKNRSGPVEAITPIPPSYYTISYLTLGPVTALIATFNQPLSTVHDQSWSDDIYATLKSPVGPNTVDILIWLIQHYTSYGIDYTSFNHVRLLITKYPSSFPITEKKNIINTLKEIAWQARCALWLTNEKFYIKYLPEQGTPVDTITVSDIETTTMKVMTTPSEELVTKFVATYKESLAYDQPIEICIRNNIDKYGTIERSFNFYIYNNGDYVLKSAMFWSMRYSNMWKVLGCKTFLDKLTIETLDNVTIDLSGSYVANEPVVGTAQKATFNSGDFSIDLEIWLPIRLGEMKAYPLAYPAAADIKFVYPDISQVSGTFPQVPTESNRTDLGGRYNTWAVVPGPVPKPLSDTFDKTPTSDLPPSVASAPILPSENMPTIPRPSYDYDFRRPAESPVTVDSSVVSRNVIPAKIKASSESGGSDYTVLIYNQGLGADPVEVKATVPGLAPDAVLPNGMTGVIIPQAITKDRKTVTNYYFLPSPFWVPLPEA